MKKSLWAVTFVVLSVFAGVLLSKIPEESRPQKEISLRKLSMERGYILKEYNGRLSLFEEGEEKPVIIYNVFTQNLPDMDKFKLREGLRVRDREELERILEDFTS